jgi:hypothetical protein
MRTSVTFDDNAYEIASVYAKANGITFSKAINDLVRKATASEEPATSSRRLKRLPNGLLVLTGGKRITTEMVKKVLEEELE